MYKDRNGWISVKDFLPKHCEECFVWYKNSIETGNWCFTQYFAGEFVEFRNGEVTHWRPIFKGPVKWKS